MPDQQPTPTTKAELRDALDALGVAAPGTATRAELWAMYEAALATDGGTAEHDHDATTAAAPDETQADATHEVPHAAESGAGVLVPVDGPVEQSFGAWGQITAMSQSLARSNLVKSALRGRPDDIALTLLVGRDLGLAPTMALAKIHVIEGLPTLSAEAMAALIRGRGHRLTGGVERNEDGHPVCAVITGERGDTGETMTVDYTITDAVAAGLCRLDATKANGVNANGKPWEKHTSDMLWARAVSRIGRRLFADVLVGVSYTPEELGEVLVVDDRPDPNAAFVAAGWKSRDESVGAHATLGPLVKELPAVLRDGIKATHGWPIIDAAAFNAVMLATTQVLADDGTLAHDQGVAAFGETAWVAHCRERIEDAEVVEAVAVPPVQAAAVVDTGDPTAEACPTCGSLDPCECVF